MFLIARTKYLTKSIYGRKASFPLRAWGYSLSPWGTEERGLLRQLVPLSNWKAEGDESWCLLTVFFWSQVHGMMPSTSKTGHPTSANPNCNQPHKTWPKICLLDESRSCQADSQEQPLPSRSVVNANVEVSEKQQLLRVRCGRGTVVGANMCGSLPHIWASLPESMSNLPETTARAAAIQGRTEDRGFQLTENSEMPPWLWQTLRFCCWQD